MRTDAMGAEVQAGRREDGMPLKGNAITIAAQIGADAITIAAQIGAGGTTISAPDGEDGSMIATPMGAEMSGGPEATAGTATSGGEGAPGTRNELHEVQTRVLEVPHLPVIGGPSLHGIVKGSGTGSTATPRSWGKPIVQADGTDPARSSNRSLTDRPAWKTWPRPSGSCSTR